MKRFYNYFLSLLLLMVAGVSGAMAQSVYDQGDLLETEEAITSQNVLLYSQGMHGTGYLNGTGAFAQAISKTCLYRFEATGESVDGHNIYLIKQVSTGLYVKDYQLPKDGEDSNDEGGFKSGDATDMTSSAAEALKVTVTVAENGSDDAYAGATEGSKGEQDLSYTAFVIRRAELVNDGVQFFGHLGKPFHSVYKDTNAWHIYSVTEPTGRDKVLAYTAAYYGTSNTDPSTTYPAGTTPGTYKADLVTPAHQAWQEAFDALQVEGQFPLTDEEVNELCVRIESTIEALQSKDAYNPITSGYYFIKSSAGRYLYGASQSTNDFVYAGKAGEDIGTDALTLNNLKYLWKVGDVPTDSLYTITNAAMGKNLGGASVKANPAGDNGYGFTIAADAKVVVLKGVCKADDGTTTDAAVFNLINPTKEPANNKFGYHSKYDNRPVMGWDAVNSINNCYTFIPVSADEASIAALLAQDKQNKLNEELGSAFATATTYYNGGNVFNRPEGATYTGSFTEEGKMVSATGDEDNSNWWCNKKQSGEGTYEALTDNDPTTYFHSNWGGGDFTPSIENNHYLVAKLDAPASGDIMIKVAKRATGNDYPTQFAVYGSNDFTKDKGDASTWVFQGYADISYTDSVAYLLKDAAGNDSIASNIKDGVGVAYAHLDDSYAYLRFSAIKTQFNAGRPANNRGYFCLAQMNVWPTTGVIKTITPEYNEVLTTSPEVYAALGEEIKKASDAIAAGTATQTEIDALNVAVENFKNNIPVPSRVTDAYNTAKAFLDAANTNDLIGTELAQYSQDAATALQATLAKYEGFDKIDLVSINAAVADINASFNAFKGSLRLPKAGKYYTIKSASKKVVSEENKGTQGYQGTLYNAIIYSASNNNSKTLSNANSAIRLTFANHSGEVTPDGETSLDAMISQLTDSVSLKEDASYVWKAEKAQDGKIVLRNLATGMYIAGENGRVFQSTEPTAILGEGVRANVFRFNLGANDDGVTQYMNIQGATSTVVPWRNAYDENSFWQFHELAKDEFTTESFTVKGVTEGQFYAATFPVAVNSDGNAIVYTVLGVNEAKDKLVLAEVKDEVPAGTPIIFLADYLINNGDDGTVGNLTIGCEDLSRADFVFRPKIGNGLFGTICEPIEITEICGHLVGDRIVTGAYTVPCNGAYLAKVNITYRKGDATIRLADGVGDVITCEAAESKLLKTEEEVTSQNVLLYSQGIHGDGYMNGTGAFAQTISKTCLYRFEATGKSVDGHNIYLIKQIATGLYVKDHEVAFSDNIGDSSDEGGFASGDFIDMTASVAEAMKVTVTKAIKDSDDPYAGATEGHYNEQDLSYTAFVIRRAELVKGQVQYFGHLGKPFFSNYIDTNAWHIYSAVEPTGRDKVLAYTAAYYDTSNSDPAETYPAGTTPGTYKADLVNPAHQAWQEAFDALQVEGPFPLTNEQVDELCVRIESTMEALQSKNAYNPIVPGYYFINSTAGRYLYGASQGDKDFVYAGKVGEDINTTAVTKDNLKYLWKVVDTPSDSLYTIQNVVYGENLGGASVKANPAGDNGYGFTIAADAKVVVLKGVCKADDGTVKDAAVFNLINPTKEPANNKFGYHSKYDNRPVMGWDAVNSINNCYTFIPVSADEASIAALLAQDKQNKLNEELGSVYAAATTYYNGGNVFNRPEGATYTGSFTEEGKMVSATGDEDNSNWWCNKKQSGEGTYEALTDNDPNTYFHSIWASGEFVPSIENNHYLVAKLDAPASGDIMIKVAKRATGNDYPTQFSVYGANDFNKATGTASWVFQGYADISYTDSVAYTMKDAAGNDSIASNIKDGVGVAYAHLDDSYAYLRFSAIKTQYNAGRPANNRGYFCLAQMNVWPTTGVIKTITPEYNEVLTASPEVYAALGEEINKAAAEIAAGKATQAQIDALNAAIDAFKNCLPVPSRVTDAYNAAKAFLDAANTNDMIGTELAQYSQEAADALQATLANYEGFDKIDFASINAAVKDINASLAAFKASVRLPEAGKCYTLKSASKKVVAEADKSAQGYQGTIYNAIVYSAGNNNSKTLSNANSAIRLTFANHSSEVTSDGETSLDAMMANLTDSVSLKEDASYVWKVETAQDGKIVLRNLATGMYIAGENGRIFQSTEPTAILGEGVRANVFRFNLGANDDGVTQYMNTQGATSTVVPWRDAYDENSFWQFHELAEDEFTTLSFTLKGVKQGEFYAATFPVSVNSYNNAILYTVLGVNLANDKLILAETFGDVLAGTPCILLADNVSNNGEGTVGNVIVGCEDLSSVGYVFDAMENDGLVGTICEPVEIAETFGHFDHGKVVTGAYVVPCNSAYLAYATVTFEEGDATLELDRNFGGILTAIDSDKVVVLPSEVDVYDANGQLIKKGVKAANAKKELPAGVYIINGQKVLVK